MTKQITRQQLSAALVERHGQERQQHLYTASVGIAGLGGLGSNIAVQLTRLGIGHLTLADCDRVEISNLNRQSYRLCDIGRPKPEALTEQLLQINPYLCYEPHFLKLTPQNIPEIFAGCNIICEAFDDPEQKAMLTETVLQRLPQAKLILDTMLHHIARRVKRGRQTSVLTPAVPAWRALAAPMLLLPAAG